jgi:hypothetical protein
MVLAVAEECGYRKRPSIHYLSIKQVSMHIKLKVTLMVVKNYTTKM